MLVSAQRVSVGMVSVTVTDSPCTIDPDLVALAACDAGVSANEPFAQSVPLSELVEEKLNAVLDVTSPAIFFTMVSGRYWLSCAYRQAPVWVPSVVYHWLTTVPLGVAGQLAEALPSAVNP